ncbi:hypothetical protein ACOME3_007422 [Neoechinorhynchus agilis]
MLLLFRIHFFVYLHILTGLPAIDVQSDVEQIQYSRQCTDYEVLKESLVNPTMNVDRCGDPLRITKTFCHRSNSPLYFYGFLYQIQKCFDVMYTYSRGCRDYVVYVRDPLQASQIAKKLGRKELRISRKRSCLPR